MTASTFSELAADLISVKPLFPKSLALDVSVTGNFSDLIEYKIKDRIVHILNRSKVRSAVSYFMALQIMLGFVTEIKRLLVNETIQLHRNPQFFPEK